MLCNEWNKTEFNIFTKDSLIRVVYTWISRSVKLISSRRVKIDPILSLAYTKIFIFKFCTNTVYVFVENTTGSKSK